MKKILFFALMPIIFTFGSCLRINYNGNSDADGADCGFEYRIDNDDAYLDSRGGGMLDRPVKMLDIDWVQGEVVLKVWDKKNVAIEESALGLGTLDSTWEIRYGLDADGRLYIRFAPEGKYIVSKFAGKRLVVNVPADCILDSLVINSVNAIVELNGIHGAKLDVESVDGNIKVNESQFVEISLLSVSGDVDLSKVDVKTVEMQSISGDITVEHVVGEKISTNTASGDIALSGTQCSTAELETISGDIEFDTKDDGYELKTSTVSGEVHCLKPAVKNGDKYTIGTGNAKIKLSTASGDIIIK